MRIYSNKTYIILSNDPINSPLLVDGKKLREMVKASALLKDDIVYEASVFAKAKEKRTVELVDVDGALVEVLEPEQEGLGLPQSGG
jgi:hypothetical protein